MKISLTHLTLIPVLLFTMVLNATAQEPLPTTAPQSMNPEAEAQQLLMNAHSIAIIDADADHGLPPIDTNSTRRFIAALKQWGQYQIVRDETQADVVLVLSSTGRPVEVAATEQTDAYTYTIPFLKLTIEDAQNRIPVWTVTTRVLSGTKHGKDLFQMSVQNVVSQVKLLDGVTLTKQEAADVNYLHDRRVRAAWIGLGATALLAGGTAAAVILARNAFNNDVAKQKQSGLDWCTANHVPLSECPANY